MKKKSQHSPTRGRFAEDRFDRVPSAGKNTGQIGAHRMVARRNGFWPWLLMMLVAIFVLVAAGIFGLSRIGTDSIPFADGVPDSKPGTERVQAVVDPEKTVAVLNEADVPGLAEAVGDEITKNGWGQVVYIGAAHQHDQAITAVFYAGDANLAAAEGLARQLGGASTYLNASYDELGADLVVILGDDYVGPGHDRAAEFVRDQESGFEFGDGDDGSFGDEEFDGETVWDDAEVGEEESGF